MSNITLRFAARNDMDKIRCFIQENWNSEHIFVHDPGLFAYEFTWNGMVQFCVAEDHETGEIRGIEGYIAYSSDQNPDVSPVFWKVIQTEDMSLGIKILMFIIEQTQSRLAFSAGLAENTLALYKYLGYKTGKLKQYYRLSNCRNYRIAVVSEKIILSVPPSAMLLSPANTEEAFVQKFDQSILKQYMPYKDMQYILHRYFKHPVYPYHIYVVNDQRCSKSQTAVIGREIIQNGAKIFRVVDCIGNRNAVIDLGSSFQTLMDENQYEYIDFVCYGMPDDWMAKAGFVCRSQSDPNIIPHFFEPFVQKNHDVLFYASDLENLLICKADGDQDRPNHISQE